MFLHGCQEEGDRMGVGEAILYVSEALISFAQVADAFTPDEVNEYTVFQMSGGVWIGTLSYTYTSETGENSTEMMTAAFSATSNYDGKVIASGTHVTVKLKQVGTSGTVPSVYASAGGLSVSFNGGGYFQVEVNVNDASTYTRNTVGGNSTSGTTFTFGGKWTNASSGKLGIFSTGMSNVKNLHDTDSFAPYFPPGDYTFNELRKALIDQVNDDFDLNISEDTPEIPDYDDLLGDGEPDETEPTSGGGDFQFDYGEVISPSELESILDQTDYQLDELNTELPDLSFELPDATFSEVQITLLTDTLTASYNFFDSLGLSSTLIALGVVAGLIRMIRGG